MSIASKSGNNTQLVPCAIGGEFFCFEMSVIQNIGRGDRVEEDRRGGDALGSLMWGGERVPVFGLAELLGRKSSSRVKTSTILIVKPQAGSGLQSMYAVAVDSVSRVLSPRAEDMLPLPGILRSGIQAFTAAVDTGTTLALCLDAARLHPESPRGNALPAPPAVPAVERGAVYKSSANAGMLLTFMAGSLEGQPLSLGISCRQVAQIISRPPIVQVPGAPPYVLGLFKWRDHAVPVIDWAGRLGLQAEAAMDRFMVAHGGSNTFLAFPVPGKVTTEVLPIQHRPALGSRLQAPGVRGVFEWESGLLIIPDLPSFSQVN